MVLKNANTNNTNNEIESPVKRGHILWGVRSDWGERGEQPSKQS